MWVGAEESPGSAPAVIVIITMSSGRWSWVGGVGGWRRDEAGIGWAGVAGRWGQSETLYLRDDALLYIAYAMLIWAAPIPADRWHCSLWP